MCVRGILRRTPLVHRPRPLVARVGCIQANAKLRRFHAEKKQESIFLSLSRQAAPFDTIDDTDDMLTDDNLAQGVKYGMVAPSDDDGATVADDDAAAAPEKSPRVARMERRNLVLVMLSVLLYTTNLYVGGCCFSELLMWCW